MQQPSSPRSADHSRVDGGADFSCALSSLLAQGSKSNKAVTHHIHNPFRMHPLHSGRRTSERALAAPDRVHCAEEADMRSHGCGCRSRCGPSTVSAVTFAALLVFTVTATFLRSHVYLRSAVAELGRGGRALTHHAAVHCRHFFYLRPEDLQALTACGATTTTGILPFNELPVPV